MIRNPYLFPGLPFVTDEGPFSATDHEVALEEAVIETMQYMRAVAGNSPTRTAIEAMLFKRAFPDGVP